MNNKKIIEQQIRDKVKSYNSRRIGIAISMVIITAALLLFPAFGNEALYIRLAVCCSVLFLLFSSLFVISGRNAILLFLTVTTIAAILLVYNHIHPKSFFILVLINAGALWVSMKISNDFIQTAANEIETLNCLKKEATTDSLTQLLNRNGLEQAISTAWAFCKREKKNMGFLLADIDYFKSYNDTLGHLKGDDILRQIANNMKAYCKRETDIIGRIGGDEFLVFLPDADNDYIIKIAQDILSMLARMNVKASAGTCPHLSVSIGVETGIPKADNSLTDLKNRVDQALYHAKRSGRNCISYNGAIIRNYTEQSRGNVVDSTTAIGNLRTGFACQDSES